MSNDEMDRDLADRLLLLCLHSRFHPDAIAGAKQLVAAEDLNWERVERLIERERIEPLIYRAVRGQALFPPAVEARLHQDTIERATVNAFLLHELHEIVARLSDAGIDVILLKGAALALAIYGDTLPRLSGDLDLLLHWEDMDRALAVLANAGYTTAESSAVNAGEIVPFVHQWQLNKAGRLNVEVDLHWHLFGWPYFQHTTPIDWFWQTAKSLNWRGIPVAELSSEALLLHLCVHVHQHRGKHWLSSLRLLHDIAETLVWGADEIDWQLVAHQAQAFRLSIPVQQTLLYVIDRWRLDLSYEALASIRRLSATEEEARAFDQLRSLPEASDARYAFVSLAQLPGWGARLHYVGRNLLFPPAAYMRHRYRINRPFLLPLYYPYRWYLGFSSPLRK